MKPLLKIFFLVATLSSGGPLFSANAPAAAAAKTPALSPAEFDARELATFERKATLAKNLGATHVPITDGLPVASWQFDPPDDPYPAWFIQRPDFFKLFPTKEVEPFVDMIYGRRVAGLLEERCKILRKLGLKAHWGANIPQVMPETFFAAHPNLRGPRVDHPNRSKTARFSMCVDQPETVRMYVEAMKNLLTRCPEIETFAFLTQDSGSGFCWVPALYPGLNGHSDCHDRPMSERISSFLVALKDAAKQAGHEVEISMNPVNPRQWMLPSFSPEQLETIAHKLPRGIAVQGREGPDGRAYRAPGSSDAYSRGAFYPVLGLTVPDMRWLHGGRNGPRGGGPAAGTPVAANPGNGPGAAANVVARRLMSLRGDEGLIAFNGRVYNATKDTAQASVVDRLAAMRKFAAAEAGEAQADNLLETWLLLDDADRGLDALNFGDMLQFGHVLNRWVNRPMVPFPEKLTAEDKNYYRPFLFQAKGEEQAENLIDIQAMRMYEGYGAKLLFQRVIETSLPSVENAIRRVRRIRDAAGDDATRNRWELFARRLETVVCLLRSADNMVAYQAQLDRVKTLAPKPEPNPVLGVQSDWDRTDLMETARKEIDNTVRLMRLLQTTPEPLLDLAPIQQEETIMRLGPELAAQLKRKIDIMNAHWIDYDRLFTVPNP